MSRPMKNEALKPFPMESAPKDGTPVLLFEGADIYKGAWDVEGEYWGVYCGQPVVYTPEPEGWLPIPAHHPAPDARLVEAYRSAISEAMQLQAHLQDRPLHHTETGLAREISITEVQKRIDDYTIKLEALSTTAPSDSVPGVEESERQFSCKNCGGTDSRRWKGIDYCPDCAVRADSVPRELVEALREASDLLDSVAQEYGNPELRDLVFNHTARYKKLERETLPTAPRELVERMAEALERSTELVNTMVTGRFDLPQNANRLIGLLVNAPTHKWREALADYRKWEGEK